MKLNLDSEYYKDLQMAVMKCEEIRKEEVRDYSLNDYIHDVWGTTPETFYTKLGVNPAEDTIHNLFNTPNQSVRWLLPEIYRSSISLGLKNGPIYPDLIAAEEGIKQPSIIMPYINQADAMPRKVGEGETIEMGTLTYGHKTVKVYKVGRGIKIPYEMRNYCSLNVIAIFLKDLGLKMGKGLDGLAIDTLVNGDQVNGSESAPVIGIATANTLIYKDFLKPWVRGSRLGRSYGNMVAGEDTMMDIMDLAEFKTKNQTGTTVATLNVKTPVPTASNLYCHGRVDADQIILVDQSKALIKLNAQPLLVESEKIVSNQTDATYATLTTGFANLFRDGRIIMDTSLAFGSNGFPTYMDADAEENVVLY